MTESTIAQKEQITDANDQATAVEMLATEQALLDVRRGAIPQQRPIDGVFPVLDCVECGNEIGEERLRVAIKNLLCIYCANRQELRR